MPKNCTTKPVAVYFFRLRLIPSFGRTRHFPTPVKETVSNFSGKKAKNNTLIPPQPKCRRKCPFELVRESWGPSRWKKCGKSPAEQPDQIEQHDLDNDHNHSRNRNCNTIIHSTLIHRLFLVSFQFTRTLANLGVYNLFGRSISSVIRAEAAVCSGRTASFGVAKTHCGPSCIVLKTAACITETDPVQSSPVQSSAAELRHFPLRPLPHAY